MSTDARGEVADVKKPLSLLPTELPGFDPLTFCTFEGPRSSALYFQRQTLVERVITFIEQYKHLAVEQA